MRKRKKLITALLMGAVMGISLAGCNSSTGSSGEKDGSGQTKDNDKVITFWNPGTDTADRLFYEKAIEMFNENNTGGWTVENVSIQNDKYKEKLTIGMSSGECPDMYTSWSGGPMNEYIRSGFAQPVDDLYDKYGLRDVVMDGSIEQCKYEDKLYAVPLKSVAVAGFYYNQDLFDKYDIEIPQTLEELETACETLKENGITPFALANSTKWSGSMYFQCLVARKAGLEPFLNAASGEGSFEDECFEYAGEKIQEWVEKGYFSEGYNSMDEDSGQARQLLYQESAAMHLMGSWETPNLKTESEEGGSGFYDKVGWFSFPAIEGSDADTSILCGTLGDNFISFNCTGEKLEAAFELASYFCSDEVSAIKLENGLIPPIKGIDEKVSDPVSKTIVEAANDASAVQLWYDQFLDPSVANAHLEGNQKVFGLTMTPAEANQMMQDAQDEINAKRE